MRSHLCINEILTVFFFFFLVEFPSLSTLCNVYAPVVYLINIYFLNLNDYFYLKNLTRLVT